VVRTSRDTSLGGAHWTCEHWPDAVRPCDDLFAHLDVYTDCTCALLLSQQVSGKIKEADYILVHHYENAAQELDTLLGIHYTQQRSIRYRERAF
jgi:hypothetical protein